MATDTAVVHIGENSPEKIAFSLLKMIANVERRELYYNTEVKNPADRAYILDTYARCILATRGVPMSDD